MRYHKIGKLENEIDKTFDLLIKRLKEIEKMLRKWKRLLKESNSITSPRTGNRIIAEPARKPVPYRLYSAKELKAFARDDQLPPKLAKKPKGLWIKST